MSNDADVDLALRVLRMPVAPAGTLSRIEAEETYNAMLRVAQRLARRVLAEAGKKSGKDD